ncbi:MAG: hypothetical protein QNJ45_14560 [Ardenticatenaceae bacterium]|nr:hypothetical protein [Ardenticatenaceae bacterium]
MKQLIYSLFLKSQMWLEANQNRSTRAAESGITTVEWAALMSVVAVLMLSVISYIDQVNGGPVSTAVSDMMNQMVFSLEGG